jgi:hypothetical protein
VFYLVRGVPARPAILIRVSSKSCSPELQAPVSGPEAVGRRAPSKEHSEIRRDPPVNIDDGRPCRYSYSAPARQSPVTSSNASRPYVPLLQSWHGIIGALGLSCIPLVYKAGQIGVIRQESAPENKKDAISRRFREGLAAVARGPHYDSVAQRAPYKPGVAATRSVVLKIFATFLFHVDIMKISTHVTAYFETPQSRRPPHLRYVR